MDKHLSYIMTITINSLTETHSVIIMDLDTQRIITERQFDSSDIEEIAVNLKTIFLWYQPLLMIMNLKSSVSGQLISKISSSIIEERTNTSLGALRVMYNETIDNYTTYIFTPVKEGE